MCSAKDAVVFRSLTEDLCLIRTVPSGRMGSAKGALFRSNEHDCDADASP